MKNSNSQKLQLGLFIIIGTVLFIIAIYLVGQRQHMFSNTFTLSSYFQNINGLQKGNNVRYAGINIGTVKSIEMVNDSTIKVEMAIEEKISTYIKKDAVATIGSDGLVGNMIVNIVPGKGISPQIGDNDVIESYSKIGPDDILSTLSVTIKNAENLTAELLQITNSINNGKGTLSVLLNDTLMSRDLKQSITNLENTSKGATITVNEFRRLIKNIKSDNKSVLGILMNDSTSGKNVKEMISTLENTSEKLNKTANDMQQVITDIQSSEGALNYIIQDTSLVNSLKSTMDHINEGSEKFNENMEALKHNFLFRGYFRKLERQAKRESKNR